jgi:hypothetical protein
MRLDGKTNPQTATELEITKLSTVKNPAHAPALAAIIKSAAVENDVNVVKQTFLEAMGEIQLEEQTDLLMNGVWDSMWALRKSIRNTMGDTNVTNKKEVINKNIADFAATLSSIISSTTVIKSGGQDMKKEEIEKMLKEAVDPIQKKLVIAEGLANMNDVTKSLYHSLDEAGREDFLKKSPEDQAAQLTAHEVFVKSQADGSETLTLHGQTIVKSEVGAGVFTILKAQQAEIDTAREETKIEKEARQTVEYTKMAEGLYPNLPGDSAAKGSVMKTIASLPKEQQTTLTGMLKAGNEGIEMSKAYDELGTSYTNGSEDSPVAKLNKMAEDRSADKKITFAKAYDEVLQTEEGADLYAETLKS